MDKPRPFGAFECEFSFRSGAKAPIRCSHSPKGYRDFRGGMLGETDSYEEGMEEEMIIGEIIREITYRGFDCNHTN